MARARKCDRCGKFYDEYLLNSNEFYKVCLIRTENYNYRNSPKDICPECMKEFIEWYKKGQEQENEG